MIGVSYRKYEGKGSETQQKICMENCTKIFTVIVFETCMILN